VAAVSLRRDFEKPNPPAHTFLRKRSPLFRWKAAQVREMDAPARRPANTKSARQFATSAGNFM
jgi:hypothetical protein